MRIALRFLASATLLVFGLPTASADGGPPKDSQTPKDKATLYQLLDADFQELLEADPNQEPLREATRLLAETNQNSHWMNFFEATTLMRKHRSKAAIPLLMKYMVEHASFSTSHVAIPQYVDTLSVLTGEKMTFAPKNAADRQKSMEEAVIKMYKEWWQPNRKSLTTDLGTMPAARVKVVVSELLRHAEQEFASHPYHSGPDRLVSTQALYQGLTAALRHRAGRPGWWKEELHGRMMPILLKRVGFADKPTGDLTAEPTRVVFGAIPLLAVLRQDGQAPLLDKIAADEKQNNATRLTCMLALHFAGEDVNTKAVLSILNRDPRLECRVLALLALGLSEKNAGAVPKLVAALDDNNREIRLAAVHSLRVFAPKEALPKLAKVVRDGNPPELVQPSLSLLGSIGGGKAAAALVEYMEKALKGGANKKYDVYPALVAFSTATNTSWIEAGAHDPAYYAEQAERAISSWWKAHPR